MKYIKLFEEHIITSNFIIYKVKDGQEVIIRNDTQGRSDLVIDQSDLKTMLKNMGGPDSIKTDFPVNGKTSPFKIDFAMNACLFEPDGGNTGYYRFYGKDIAPINKSTEKNFGMHLDENSGERNGIFYGSGSKWDIVGTSKFGGAGGAKFAIQNGPILVMDGKINSVFKKESKNKAYRNGIGVDDNGLPCFVLSKEECNFYELAECFLNDAKCKKAIYSDGVVSQGYVRGESNGGYFEGTKGKLAPIILVTSPK